MTQYCIQEKIMYKLNSLQYPSLEKIVLNSSYSFEALGDNTELENEIKDFKKQFDFKSLNTFAFTKEGFLSLMLELGGNIAISRGECEAIIRAGELYEKLGKKVFWLALNKKSELYFESLAKKKVDFIFVSAYIMDTFAKISQEKIKKLKTLTKAKVISNFSSCKYAKFADIILFDSYKLSGYGVSGLILYSDDELKEQYLGEFDGLGFRLISSSLKKRKFFSKNKVEFLAFLKKNFQDDLFLFVDPELCLEHSLHFGLKKIKARELIRTLRLDDVLLSNGEACALGLGRPSRILQDMGYDETTSRWALSINFEKDFSKEELEKIAKLLLKKYRQIRVLND